MNPNAANRKDIRAAEKAAKQAEAQSREVVINLMNTANGREWLWSKLTDCHIFADPFTGDALGEAYRKGERNIGLALLAELMQHCPDQFILAMREANGRSTLSERRVSENFNGRDQGSGGSEPGDGTEDDIYGDTIDRINNSTDREIWNN